MKTGDLFEAAAAAGNAAQRIVPEGNRLRWEQQWLQENRRVSGVVHNDERSFAQSAAQAIAASEPIAQSDRASAAVSIAEPIDTAPGNRAALAEQIYAAAQIGVDKNLSAAPNLSAPVPGRDPMYKNSPDSTAKTTAAQPDNGAAMPARGKGDPKQFAVWRSDDEIKISMRLSHSEREHATTLHTLRQWLKGMGLKLTQLIVNGNVHWQAKSKGENHHGS